MIEWALIAFWRRSPLTALLATWARNACSVDLELLGGNLASTGLPSTILSALCCEGGGTTKEGLGRCAPRPTNTNMPESASA